MNKKENKFEDALMLLPWQTLEDVKQLISLGATVKKENAVELLKKAVKTNNPDLVDYLLKRVGGVKTLRELDSVYTPGKNEFEILDAATDDRKNQNISCLKKLVESGFNIHAGASPLLHRFAYKGYDKHEEEFPDIGLLGSHKQEEYLHSKGFGYHFLYDGDQTPADKVREIFECIDKNDIKGLIILMQIGYSPNIVIDMNDACYSPLAEAYFQNKPEIAEILLTYGGLAILGKDYDERIYTIREFLDGNVFNFHRSGQDRKRWEEVAEKEEALLEKFPIRVKDHQYRAYDSDEQNQQPSPRKKALTEMLQAHSEGKDEKAREIAEKYHKENPKQATALKFKSSKNSEQL